MHIQIRHGGMSLKRCKQGTKQIEFQAKAPVFTPARQGYDMQQVDAYVDELRAENDHLASINQLLVMLRFSELQELKQKNVALPEVSVDGSPLFWEKINWLMEQPYRRAEPDNTNYPDGSLVMEAQKMVEPEASNGQSLVKATIMNGLFYIFLIVAVLGVYLFSMESSFRFWASENIPHIPASL